MSDSFNSINRFIVLSKELERAKKEREEVIKEIITDYAPFQKGDRITDGQQIADVDTVEFWGLDKETSEPRFTAYIWPYKPNGERWQKRKELYRFDFEDWHKTDAPATPEEKLKHWQT